MLLISFEKMPQINRLKKYINIISSDCLTNNKKVFFLLVIQR